MSRALAMSVCLSRPGDARMPRALAMSACLSRAGDIRMSRALAMTDDNRHAWLKGSNGPKTYRVLLWSMKDPKKPHVYFVTSYGADPTGSSDSSEALLAAIADAAKGPSEGF
ncbi:hypothetical protein VNO80_13333 [Phaseolus coccineus]|uniref:Uncharacterized protein n=1 Tax=Phaseolus coccineus TaxID=3886 RepID=A0AAN9R9W3_PHACN